MTVDSQPHEFSDQDALAWLRERPDGRVETTVSDLARSWGWNRTKVRRRLTRWEADGHITRAAGADRQSVISVTGAPVRLPSTVEADVPTPDIRLPAEIPDPRESQGERGGHPASDRLPAHRFRVVGSIVLAAIAAAIAWFGIRINAWYGGTLGRTAEASGLLAGLSVSADMLALILPATARTLWLDRRPAMAASAWLLWSITIVIALMATVGFAALNIADTTAARGKTATEAALLNQRIERLGAERASIAEKRSVAALEAELQRVQPSATAVWRATSGCRDVTLPSSGEACAPVLAVREAIGAAQRRDMLDADLREATMQLAAQPAVSTPDPQAEVAARLMNWVAFGLIAVTPGDIHLARIAGMTLMPQVAGLVLMLAVALWPLRRPAAG